MGNISMSYYGRLKHIAMFSEAFKCTSMTSLLTHTVADSTWPSFRSKINNQPIKSLAVS